MAGFNVNGSFPAVVGPDLTHNGSRDVFVAKVSADGASLLYAGYIGGDEIDDVSDIAVEGATGAAFVVGYTSSEQDNFPVGGGGDLTYNGDWCDGFVAKVKPDGTALEWCGFLGGLGQDWVSNVLVLPGGDIAVAGRTDSSSTTFPVNVGPYLTLGGFTDAFVGRMDGATAAVEALGYVGGTDHECCMGLATDGYGNLVIAGYTLSDDGSFPVLGGPDLRHNGDMAHNWRDWFVTKVKSDFTGIWWSGFVGGSGDDVPAGFDCLAADGNLGVYVVGAPGVVDGDSGFPRTDDPDFAPDEDSVAVVKIAPANDLPLDLSKGALKDSIKVAGDSFKGAGVFTPPPGFDFDPATADVTLLLGGSVHPLVIYIAKGSAGWKWGKGKYAWKGTAGSLKLDFVKGTFSVAAKKVDFVAQQENPIRISLDIGGQLFVSEETWTESTKAPGNFKYP